MKIVRGGATEATDIIASSVNELLLDGNVLLLLSGGSNIDLACKIREKLVINNVLYVGLIDERYGAIGHTDSNWKKLLDAGFDTSNVNQLPVLNGLSIEETSSNYLDSLNNAVKDSGAVIGVFGIGDDGHTSGVLPGSPAVGDDDIVTHYKANDFQRVTTTSALINEFNEVYLVAIGGNKRKQLDTLIHEDLPEKSQPAQYLKKAKKLIIISDLFDTETS